MRVLSVAEKPSVAKKLAQILGRSGRPNQRSGPSVYNKIFDIKMELENQNVDMAITSVTGHLMQLEFEGNYSSWGAVSPNELFDAPISKSVPKDKKNVERNLQIEARKAQWLVLWLDCDREGENIAFEVIQVCCSANRNLRISRAQFSSLIPADIWRAVRSLRDPNENHSIAVDTRQELDLRLGAAFTRWQTMHFQKRFEGVDGVVSYGPCQFPTLGFVVERFLERESFVSEPFWKIAVTHKPEKDGPTAYFSWERRRLFCHFSTLVLYRLCLDNPIATVTDSHAREKRKYRPYPLATVEFQKRAVRYLRMDSKRAMDVAEKLYQKGILSYPRTETDKFSKDFDLRSLVQIQTQSPAFGAYATRLLNNNEFQNPRQGSNDDGAHPPIHPKTFDPSLSGDEKRVFDLVARHFLACCSQDAIGHETTVKISIGYESFVATGLMITARNYLEVYTFERWNTKTIPIYNLGQEFTPSSLRLENGKTEPPKLLTEADLIQLMNKNGIGTDATIAEHISKVKDRNYVLMEGQFFKPCNLGIALVQGYKRLELAMSSPYLRQKMEADISEIAEGKKSKQEVLRDCLGHMKEVYETVQQLF
eukprot:jgi/Bigna1/57958/fgenesh1_pm.42_\